MLYPALYDAGPQWWRGNTCRNRLNRFARGASPDEKPPRPPEIQSFIEDSGHWPFAHLQIITNNQKIGFLFSPNSGESDGIPTILQMLFDEDDSITNNNKFLFSKSRWLTTNKSMIFLFSLISEPDDVTASQYLLYNSDSKRINRLDERFKSLNSERRIYTLRFDSSQEIPCKSFEMLSGRS